MREREGPEMIVRRRREERAREGARLGETEGEKGRGREGEGGREIGRGRGRVQSNRPSCSQVKGIFVFDNFCETNYAPTNHTEPV